ncbi:hypothetical protein AB6A40_001884 [Gnathostoma spinigerum]|uniref:Uncharacterized protein n=1 Tax=Gnathostoma spinigerum TaxID=75299 RepID=A0ABD6E689_9BILA
MSAADKHVFRRTKSSKSVDPHVMLLAMHFPNDGTLPNTEWTFEDTLILHHMNWSPDECKEWISLRTLKQEISEGNVSNSGLRNESMNSSARSSGGHLDTSLLVMIWKTWNSEYKGAVFDLNAFYYKRLVPNISFDGTIAKLCPFLSIFSFPSSDLVTYGAPLDVGTVPLVQRFKTPWSDTTDVLFYASSLRFELSAFTSSHLIFLEILSIQDEVLNYTVTNIANAMGTSVIRAKDWVGAVGLSNLSASSVSHLNWHDQWAVISSLLYNGRGDGIKIWLESHATIKDYPCFAEHLWTEIEIAKERLDEMCAPLFNARAYGVPQTSINWIECYASVFHLSSELFGLLSQKHFLDGNSKSDVVCQARIATTLSLYARMLLFFYRNDILPETESVMNTKVKVAKLYSDRLSRAAITGRKLELTKLLNEICSVDDVDRFWPDRTDDGFYPPKSIGMLLSLVLTISIKDTAKLRLIGYYLHDCDLVSSNNKNLFQQFTSIFFSHQNAMDQFSDLLNDSKPEGYPGHEWSKLEYDRLLRKTPCDVESLLKLPILSEEQLAVIKSSYLMQKDGKTLWNKFCMSRRLFLRLVEPDDCPKNEQWKVDCDKWARKHLRLLSKMLPLQKMREKRRKATGSPHVDKETFENSSLRGTNRDNLALLVSAHL